MSSFRGLTASSAWRSIPTWPMTPPAPSPRPGRLWAKLDRPNVFIKVPATQEGLPAIRQLISEGINVNVTLLFGLPRYRQVAEAYLGGLAERAAQGLHLNVASVASFFLSRIDVLLDPQLEKMARTGGPLAAAAASLQGEAAIASAKVAYSIYQQIFGSQRFQALAAKGAQSPAPALGQHQHQKPGLPRRQVRRAPHRPGDRQHVARGDPEGLPGPRPPRPAPGRRTWRRLPRSLSVCRSWASTSTRPPSGWKTKEWKNLISPTIA